MRRAGGPESFDHRYPQAIPPGNTPRTFNPLGRSAEGVSVTNRYLGSSHLSADSLGLTAPGEPVGTIDRPDAPIDEGAVIETGDPVLDDRRRVPEPDGVAHEIHAPVRYAGDNIDFVAERFAELWPLLKAADALVRLYAEGGTPDPAEVQRYLEGADADHEFLDEEIPDALTQARDGIDRVGEALRAMNGCSQPVGQGPS